MSGPARAGLFIYAKDLSRLAKFYESFLGMTRAHATPDLVVLRSPDIQLTLHAMPPAIAASVTISDPPAKRDNTALKFIFTVPSLAQAQDLAPRLAERFCRSSGEGRASPYAMRSIQRATFSRCARVHPKNSFKPKLLRNSA